MGIDGLGKAIFLALSFATASCGSGLFGAAGAVQSGDSGAEPFSVRVVDRLPEQAAEEADPESLVVIGFDAVLDPNFDATGVIALTDSAGVPVDGVTSVDGNRVEFRPSERLQLRSQYVASVDADLRFSNGEVRRISDGWYFAVRSGVYGPSQPILTFANVERVTTNDQGRMATLSRGELSLVPFSNETSSTLLVSYELDGGGWSAPTILAVGDNTSSAGFFDGITEGTVTWAGDGDRLIAGWEQSIDTSPRCQLSEFNFDEEIWESLPDLPQEAMSHRVVPLAGGRIGVFFSTESRVVLSELVAGVGWVETYSQALPVVSLRVVYDRDLLPNGQQVLSWSTFSDRGRDYVFVDPSGSVISSGSIRWPGQRLHDLSFGEDGSVLFIADSFQSENRFQYRFVPADGGPEIAGDLTDDLFIPGEFVYGSCSAIGSDRFIFCFGAAATAGASRDLYADTLDFSTGALVADRVRVTDHDGLQAFSSIAYVQTAGSSGFGVVAAWLRSSVITPGEFEIETASFRPSVGWGEVRVPGEAFAGCGALPHVTGFSKFGTQSVVWTQVSDCNIGGKPGPPQGALVSLSITFE